LARGRLRSSIGLRPAIYRGQPRPLYPAAKGSMGATLWNPAPCGGLPSPCAPAPERFTREGLRYVKICAPACMAMRHGGGWFDAVWSGEWEAVVAGGLMPFG
jgi:hypothetical protein